MLAVTLAETPVLMFLPGCVLLAHYLTCAFKLCCQVVELCLTAIVWVVQLFWVVVACPVELTCLLCWHVGMYSQTGYVVYQWGLCCMLRSHQLLFLDAGTPNCTNSSSSSTSALLPH